MKKMLVSGTLFALVAVASPVSADGGMMPVSYQTEPTQPVTIQANPNYSELVNGILLSVLEMFTWTNDDGEIAFENNNYSAQYDCNTLAGQYSVNLTQMNFGTAAMTRMACAEDAMDADQELADDLAAVTEFTFEDGQLVMTGADTELVFTASLPEAIDYTGMTVDEAEQVAEENGVMFRIGKLDGEDMMLTQDYRPGRITAEVEDDIVVSYTVE
jgi:heat shock protein HslJ